MLLSFIVWLSLISHRNDCNANHKNGVRHSCQTVRSTKKKTGQADWPNPFSCKFL
ncbi:MAG: hypothetical protein EHM38_00475 [Geobacteraceae bacterium]|nr:MAG: hypothetical protein EHM38_06140 [Geobacteraceae bacterium]RPI73381.1 MAG: hypothetical protein EHM38_00475 [Geobacteraceae bacterium]